MVDGRQWKRGDPSGGLAGKARLIYGSRHEDFIDNVKPNGDYLTVRFNGKEDNLVLWTFNKGARKVGCGRRRTA